MSLDAGIGYGLATAGGAGSADYLAKTTTDRVGFLSTLAYLQFVGLPILVALAWFVEGPRALPIGPLIGLLLLAFVSLTGLLFLYRAFELGRLSVVAPLTSGYPALSVLLSVVILREGLTPTEALGIVGVLSGAVLVSWRPARGLAPARDPRGGILAAVLAFVAFGFYYFGLKFVIGPIPPLTGAALTRLVGVGTVAVALGLRGGLVLPPAGLRARALAFPALDSLALVAFNLGLLASTSLAVLVTVSGLYGAVTLAWAVVLLGDRPSRSQWGGAAAIFLGIVALSVGGG